MRRKQSEEEEMREWVDKRKRRRKGTKRNIEELRARNGERYW